MFYNNFSNCKEAKGGRCRCPENDKFWTQPPCGGKSVFYETAGSIQNTFLFVEMFGVARCSLSCFMIFAGCLEIRNDQLSLLTNSSPPFFFFEFSISFEGDTKIGNEGQLRNLLLIY